MTGELLPDARPPPTVADRLMPRPVPMLTKPGTDCADVAGTGLIAGASVGRDARPRSRGPRLSLKLRDNPGRLRDLTGELANVRSLAFLLGVSSLTLALRRSSCRTPAEAVAVSPRLGLLWDACIQLRLTDDLDSCGNASYAVLTGRVAAELRGAEATASMLDDGGRLKSKPGSTPLLGLTILKGSSIGVE